MELIKRLITLQIGYKRPLTRLKILKNATLPTNFLFWKILVTFYLKMLLTGNSTQYSVMTYMGKESEKGWIYVYV